LLVGIAPTNKVEQIQKQKDSELEQNQEQDSNLNSNQNPQIMPIVDTKKENNVNVDVDGVEDDEWFNDLIADSSPQEMPSITSTKKMMTFDHGNNTNTNNMNTNFSPKSIYKDTPHIKTDDIDSTTNKESYYAVVDLNKAPQVLVEQAKEHMNICFEQNRVLSTDTEYVYDKQVEFTIPVESNEWDDEED